MACLLAGCGDGGPAGPEMEPPAPVYVQLTAGARHNCALDGDGQAYCWGYAGDGALGPVRDLDAGLRPVALPGGWSFTGIAAGSSFTCGTTADDRTVCWGFTSWGWFSTPTEVPVSLRPGSLDARLLHACGITPGGSVACWGVGDLGQIGAVDRTGTPVFTDGIGDVVEVRTGARMTCALNSGGEVWCWGGHPTGELGVGTPVLDTCAFAGGRVPCSATPLRVSLPEPAAALAAGYHHACALTESSRVFCWGLNSHGQVSPVSDGPEVCVWNETVQQACARAPVEYPGVDAHAEGLHAGGGVTCTVSAQGAGACWGVNTFGQLGGGGATRDDGPTPLAGGLTWSTIAMGQIHTCGLTTDGLAYCWGDGQFGQLGSFSEHSPQPKPVSPPRG